MDGFISKIMGICLGAVEFARTSPLFRQALEFLSAAGPIQLVLLFLVSSMVMVWRLNAVERKGFQGTMVGTLIMPYCSGFSNLAFAYVMGRSGHGGGLVVENCMVNNLTNLTLVLGGLALFWGLKPRPADGDRDKRISYISLLLSLTALLFFTGAAWTLARDGSLDFSDGIMLCGLFVFWQIIHVFEVKKNNVLKKQAIAKSVILDLALAGLGAFATLYSIQGLVDWVALNGKGILSLKYLGIVSGVLMVVPNAFLALYYCLSGKPDIAYASQVGDSHICIPLCIGLYAIFAPIDLPWFFLAGILALTAAGGVHLFFTTFFGRLPRLVGGILVLGYGVLAFRGFNV